MKYELIPIQNFSKSFDLWTHTCSFESINKVRHKIWNRLSIFFLEEYYKQSITLSSFLFVPISDNFVLLQVGKKKHTKKYFIKFMIAKGALKTHRTKKKEKQIKHRQKHFKSIIEKKMRSGISEMECEGKNTWYVMF